MKVTAHDIFVVSVGEHGPFEDGRTIPFCVLLDDSDNNWNATIVDGVTPPRRRSDVNAELEVYKNRDGDTKVRLLGWAPADGRVAEGV